MFEVACPEQQQTFPPLNHPIQIEGRISCQTSKPNGHLYILYTKTDVRSYDAFTARYGTLEVEVSASSIGEHTAVVPLQYELEERVLHSAIYEDRIDYLRRVGHEDGIELNKSSEDDFYLFIKATRSTRKASLVLTDSGNLRSVWKGDDGEHIGVQFHGGEIGSYVIFKRRSSAQKISRSCGKDTLDGVRRQIGVLDLLI